MGKLRQMLLVSSAVTLVFALVAPSGAALGATTGKVRYTSITRKLFLRNPAAPDDTGGCTTSTEILSDEDGTDPGNGCAMVLTTTAPVAENAPTDPTPDKDLTFTETFVGAKPNVKLPMIINAKKHITGTIAITSLTPVQAAKLDVIVTLNDTALESFSIDPGPTTGTEFFDGDPSPAYDIDIPIPAELNKKAVKSLSLTVQWRQAIDVGGSVWVEMENPASYIQVPALRKVG